MTKIEKLINKKVNPVDYQTFVNPIHQKMRDENNNTLPTFKETSGNRNTWCRSGTWNINTQTTWEDIIHSACHWIEYRKYGSDAKIHNLNSFRMEKTLVEYA